MDRLEELLPRLREPRKCAELLLGAPAANAVAVAQQLAAVPFSLPAAHCRYSPNGESIMQTILHIIQLAVAGFVAWGGWLCVSSWVRELRGARDARADTAASAPARADSFERAASLVLLALLCTTIAALA